MAIGEFYIKRIKSAAVDIIENEGVTLLEIALLKEHSRNIVRIYIYDKDGVKIKTCTSIAKQLNRFLEEDEMLIENFNIEVSSPGTSYKLKDPEHYKIYSGKTVKVKFIQPVDEIKAGIAVMNFNNENDICFLFTNENDKTVTTEFNNIRMCKIYEQIKFK
ncbi:hypothetical protein KAJ27_25395 [bacterium]|nr:hypothetical protein [bacterium]